MLAPGFDEKLAADVAAPSRTERFPMPLKMESQIEAAADFEIASEEADTSFDFAEFDDDGQGLLGLEPLGRRASRRCH